MLFIKVFSITTLFLLFSCQNLYAAIESVDYSLGCKAKLDTQKMSRDQYDAISSIYFPGDFKIMTWGDLDFHNELKTGDLKSALLKKKNQIEKEFSSKNERLKKLSVGDKKIWLDTRSRAMNHLKLSHAIARSQIDFLLNNKTKNLIEPLAGHRIPNKCFRYIEGVKDNNSLRKFSPIFAKERCENNSDKIRCYNDLSFKPNSQNAILKFSILNLGLENCAMHLNSYIIWTERQTAELEKNLQDIICDEP